MRIPRALRGTTVTITAQAGEHKVSRTVTIPTDPAQTANGEDWARKKLAQAAEHDKLCQVRIANARKRIATLQQRLSEGPSDRTLRDKEDLVLQQSRPALFEIMRDQAKAQDLIDAARDLWDWPLMKQRYEELFAVWRRSERHQLQTLMALKPVRQELVAAGERKQAALDILYRRFGKDLQ